MVPSQTFESFPVFSDTGTKVKPGDAKYSAGFQQSDVLPAEWVNWEWNKASKGITDLNTGLTSVEAEINSVLTGAKKSPDATKTNQLYESIAKLIDDAETRAKLAAHPIGSLYWSSDSTDPGQLFGGTWAAIKDCFVWAKGDSDTVNATGGAKTVTLQEGNLPSHHHSVGAHSHGLNSHTHTLNTGNTSSSGTKTTAGIRHSGNTGAMSANSTGSISNMIRKGDSNFSPSGNMGATNGADTGWGMGGGSLHIYYGTISNNVAHTHSLPSSYIYGSTDAATGSTANSSAFDSGNTGDGTAVNVMNPYTVKYCWERVS